MCHNNTHHEHIYAKIGIAPQVMQITNNLVINLVPPTQKRTRDVRGVGYLPFKWCIVYLYAELFHCILIMHILKDEVML